MASLDEADSADEAERMRRVLSELLRHPETSGSAKSGDSAAVMSDDLSMADGLVMDGLSDMGSAELDALLESEVRPDPYPVPTSANPSPHPRRC